MFDLASYLPYLVNRVGVRLANAFGKELTTFGVTLPMWRVMAALRDRRSLSVGRLSEATSIEVSTLSRLLAAMDRRGLVRRQSASRCTVMTLTRPYLAASTSISAVKRLLGTSQHPWRRSHPGRLREPHADMIRRPVAARVQRDGHLQAALARPADLRDICPVHGWLPSCGACGVLPGGAPARAAASRSPQDAACEAPAGCRVYGVCGVCGLLPGSLTCGVSAVSCLK